MIRFAPSTTGYAHPGTLLSGLLCWLDARSSGVPIILRLENIDPDRSRPEYESAMLEDLAWLGLDWDRVTYQSQNRSLHEHALDKLQEMDALYPCSCSRARMKELGVLAPDGGFVYDNACRNRSLPPGGWRACTEPVRVRLPDRTIDFIDEGGVPIKQQPVREMGDPVVRRRDGAIAYHLACVVDDAALPVTRLIRGRDLIHSAPIQIVLQSMLGYPTPLYRHHFLLLDDAHGKLAKFHGSVGAPELKNVYRPEELCGLLAYWCGILKQPEAYRPVDLLSLFRWNNIRHEDLTVRWDGRQLDAVVE